MRSYRKLKAEGRLNLLDDLKVSLSEEQFNRVNFGASKIMFGASHDYASLVLRQYLYNHLLLKHRFNKAILFSLGSGKPIRFPLPKEWEIILKKEGFEVDHFWSNIQWLLVLFIYFSFGIYRALGLFKSAIFNKTGTKLNAHFVYFHNLSRLNIPPTKNPESSKNIMTWYDNWIGKKKLVNVFNHDVRDSIDFEHENFKINYAPISRQNLGSVKSLLSFFCWFVFALILCVKDLILRRWWTFILFEQFVQASALRNAEEEFIAKDYLLPHTGVFYRPIWTYEVEKRNSRVILYFYSTNNEQFKTKDGYISAGNGWKLSSWPLVLVWDDYQAEFVRRSFFSYGKIEIVGEIWFSSSNTKKNIQLDNDRSIKIALFDVQPHRSSRFQVSATLTDYYDSSVAIQFHKDVHEALDGHLAVIFHKRKRAIGNMLHPKYRNYLDNLDNTKHISIDPDLSANDLINDVDLVISMPFTSTAFLGYYQNKPSIFYDPFGDVLKDDRAAHGIPIIIGVDELKSWLSKTILHLDKLENTNA